MSQMDEINRLRQKAEQMERELKDKQRECGKRFGGHSFGEPYYNPTTKQEGVFSHYEGHGSDPYPVYNYHDKEVSRWTRRCKNCEYEEHTTELRPSGPSKPYFG